MDSLLDKSVDDKIRTALRKVDRIGRLGILADRLGIAGGKDELQRIMNSAGELPIIDRGMIGMELGLVK